MILVYSHEWLISCCTVKEVSLTSTSTCESCGTGGAGVKPCLPVLCGPSFFSSHPLTSQWSWCLSHHLLDHVVLLKHLVFSLCMLTHFSHLCSALKFSGILAGCELYLILCQFTVPYHVCETLSSGNSCSIALGVFLVHFWSFLSHLFSISFCFHLGTMIRYW